MAPAACPYCGIAIRWRRKDERCVGCGKLLPSELQADAAEVPPLLPPALLTPEEPRGARSRVGELLLSTLLSMLFVSGSALLAVVGLLLFVMSIPQGISWLTITGAVLGVPFAVVICALYVAWGNAE